MRIKFDQLQSIGTEINEFMKSKWYVNMAAMCIDDRRVGVKKDRGD
jgi:hypothetical protein